MKWLVICVCLVLTVIGQPAAAHDSQPLLVQIDEQSPLLYRVQTKLPPSMGRHVPPQISLGSDCTLLSETRAKGTASSEVAMFRCGRSLRGSTVRLTFPDYNPSLAIVFRFQPVNGPVLSQLQPPDRPQWNVPDVSAATAKQSWDTALRYGRLGIEHILFGLDHLLFVTCLLLLADTLRRTLFVITGFTVAHSLTLGLAALNVARPPTAVIEMLIALSIIMVATELARRDRDTLAWRNPMLVSMVFGLLHGFGFAAALAEIGLPINQELLALLAFNAGVEVGQIFFVILAIGILGLMTVAIAKFCKESPKVLLTTPSAYLVGTLASFWFFQRVSVF